MAKVLLNQAIAISDGEKKKMSKELTEVYHLFQKPDLFDGFTKTYHPFEDDPTGKNQLPAEEKMIQCTVSSLLERISNAMERGLNAVASVDFGNTTSLADVVVDGKVLIEKAPVTFLIYLEKQLVDLRTEIESIPLRDPSIKWSFDADNEAYRSPIYETFRTKKEPRRFEKAPATDKHPAQVEVFMEDTPIGKYNIVKFTAALSLDQKKDLISRVSNLINAVKFAREEANSNHIEQVKVAGKLLNYMFGDI